MESMQKRIEQRLQEAFSPNHLKVVNESEHHIGHMGDDGSGETHFKVEIKSQSFDNKSKVASHRMIYYALHEEMKKIHALSINIKK